MVRLPGWVPKFLPNPIKHSLDQRARVIQTGIVFRAMALAELHGLYPIPRNWPKGIGTELTLKGKFAAWLDRE